MNVTKTPLTPEELAIERAYLLKIYAEQGMQFEAFTCDDCASRFTCEYVFDGYNTDGDCIAEK